MYICVHVHTDSHTQSLAVFNIEVYIFLILLSSSNMADCNPWYNSAAPASGIPVCEKLDQTSTDVRNC